MDSGGRSGAERCRVKLNTAKTSGLCAQRENSGTAASRVRSADAP